MHVTPDRSARPARRCAHQLLFALVVWLIAATACARADVTNLDGANAPIVRVNIRAGNVIIRTWERNTVSVDADPSVSIQRMPFHPAGILGSLPIPATGAAATQETLPAESFVPAIIPSGPRDSIVIRSDEATGPGPVTVTVPNDSPLVFVSARGGKLEVRGYHGGTFVGFTSFGRLSLSDVGGTVFAQTARGAIVVSDSTIDRIRARSVVGNITFERCVAHQIETTAILGSIVFDGGSFQPGLARFESVHGDVAVGSEAASQLSAHTAGGRIYTSFLGPTQVVGRDGDMQATIGGGGPVVTASSETGNVYLYDGSLRTRALPGDWQRPTQVLVRPGTHPEAAPAARPFAPAARSEPRKFRWSKFPKRN